MQRPCAELQAAVRIRRAELADVIVQAIDADDYLIKFGDLSTGHPQPLFAVANINFSASEPAFLASVDVSMVREPGTTNDIPVSNNPALTAAQNWAQTAQNIEYAFQQPDDGCSVPTWPTGTTSFPLPGRVYRSVAVHSRRTRC